MKITILGCGTSGGVPRVGNIWGVCDPENPKNRRRRVSILVEEGLVEEGMVEEGATRILVDTSPDLREQLLDARVDRLDAVFYTHDHADHTHGIDDLRGIFHCMGKKVPVYADKATLDVLQRRFDYAFTARAGYPAMCEPHLITGPETIGALTVEPFEQIHGAMTSLGFRFGAAGVSVAYSTDLNGLPEAALAALQGLDLWIVDALRPEPHPTHSHLARTLDWIAEIRPRRAILTHMTWDMDYETLKKSLPDGVEPAYDGQIIEI